VCSPVPVFEPHYESLSVTGYGACAALSAATVRRARNWLSRQPVPICWSNHDLTASYWLEQSTNTSASMELATVF
jgi:hypothetical protein